MNPRFWGVNTNLLEIGAPRPPGGATHVPRGALRVPGGAPRVPPPKVYSLGVQPGEFTPGERPILGHLGGIWGPWGH